jgi:hypothetical protein
VLVLAGLVYAAQRQAQPAAVPVEVQPEQVLPSTKAALPPELLPSTKADEAPVHLLLPSTKAAPVRLPEP